MLLGRDELTILRGSKFYGTWQWINSVTGEPEDFAGLSAIVKIKNIHEEFSGQKNTYEVGIATVEPLDVDGNAFKGRVDIELSKDDTLHFAIPQEEEDKYGESDFYAILEILLSTGEVILQAKVRVVESLESETLNFLLDERAEAIIINGKLDNILARNDEFVATRDNLIDVVIPTAIDTYNEKLDLYNQNHVEKLDTYNLNHTDKLQILESIATIVGQDKNIVGQDKLDIEIMKQNVQDNKDSVTSMKDAIEIMLDTFDDRFLGKKDSDPTTDNDGEPLSIAALYYNEIDKELKFYNGVSWDSPVAAAQTYAQQASNSATNAANSATSASSSATSASSSATSASSSATSATSSKNAAATSATNAANSASTATTKANEASASATSASNSATSASQSLDSINGILATLPDGTINDTLIGVDKAFSSQSLVGAFGRLSSPLLDLPLKNNLTMKAGVGSTTFTRASTATYIDRYGVLKTASIDEPRFEKEGYLNEGSSTNLLTYSDNMLIGYTANKATLALSTTELSPDGITYATEFRETTVTGGSYVYKSTTFTAGTTYTQSIFAKSINGQNLQLVSFNTSGGFDKTYSAMFDLTTGTISGSGASNAKIVPLSNGWYRCSITATCITTSTSNVQLATIGTNYESPDYGLYIFGVQLEEKPFASSYIPTTDSAVTRSADVLQVIRENNFPNAENNPEGYSVAFTYDSLGTRSTNQFLWALYVDANNYARGDLLVGANSVMNRIGKNGVSVLNLTNPAKPLGSNRVVQMQSNTSLKQYINGALADTDVNTLGTLGGGVNRVTNIIIGGISTSPIVSLFGHISDFKVYDRDLTPVEVALL